MNMNIRLVRDTLARHRFLGKYGWHYTPSRTETSDSGSGNSGYLRSAEYNKAWMVKLSIQAATRLAQHLLDGELVWGQLTRNLQELIEYRSTLGDKQQYLSELAAALQAHPLKNRALGRRLGEVADMSRDITNFANSRNHLGADELAKQALQQAATLLQDGETLVLMVPNPTAVVGGRIYGLRKNMSQRQETGPDLFSPEQIDEARRTWFNFPGFSGESCSECKATANVLAGGPGWFCECGQYNVQSWSHHQMPHETPDYGPTMEQIRVGVHASCGEDCTHCHGTIRLHVPDAA